MSKMPLIASVSGGKDSTAMALWLKEQGIHYRAVMMDTGWESPITIRYVAEVLQPRIGPIEIIRPPLGMIPLILKKGMFPSRTVRYCTQQLKVFPYLAWVRDQYADQPVVNARGNQG